MKDVFNIELKYIKNKKYRDNLEIMLNLLPQYFFKVAASSTGKYHPSFSLGEGGLVRHTKTAVNFAISLFDIYKLDESTKDLIIISLLIHDGLK